MTSAYGTKSPERNITCQKLINNKMKVKSIVQNDSSSILLMAVTHTMNQSQGKAAFSFRSLSLALFFFFFLKTRII